MSRLTSCRDFEIEEQTETYCCDGCINEHETGYVSHDFSVLYEGKWLDVAFCCCRHYSQMEEALIAKAKEKWTS